MRLETAHGSGEFGFQLDAGEHALQVGHGEPGARIDAIFVSNDVDAMPPSLMHARERHSAWLL
ncbi:MAG: hypothetical protein R3C68_06780 [Myxococcota bacterium]